MAHPAPSLPAPPHPAWRRWPPRIVGAGAAGLWILGEPAVGPVIATAALAWGPPTHFGVRPWSVTWLASAALTTGIDTPVLSFPFWIALLTPPLAVPLAVLASTLAVGHKAQRGDYLGARTWAETFAWWSDDPTMVALADIEGAHQRGDHKTALELALVLEVEGANEQRRSFGTQLRALALLDLGRPAEALPLLDAVLALRPESASTRVGRARAHWALGNPAAAEIDVALILERDDLAAQPDEVAVAKALRVALHRASGRRAAAQVVLDEIDWAVLRPLPNSDRIARALVG